MPVSFQSVPYLFVILRSSEELDEPFGEPQADERAFIDISAYGDRMKFLQTVTSARAA
jgi:hypothetical protein